MDAEQAAVLALATFAIGCIGVISQLLAELRRGRRDLGSERLELVDETKRRREIEEQIDRITQELTIADEQRSAEAAKIVKGIAAATRREDDRSREQVEQNLNGIARGPVARRKLYDAYALTHDGLTEGVLNGTEPLPDDWVRNKLAEWGLPNDENPTRRRWWQIS